MNAMKAYTIEDLRQSARRRLPRAVFDFIDGGAEEEGTLRDNRAAFSRLRLAPKMLVDVSRIDTSTTILGGPARLPLAIAPTGAVGFGWRGRDVAIRKAAAAAGIPYSLSMPATALASSVARNNDASLDWEVLKQVRDRWPGKMLVKGILRPDDAERAVAVGCEGVIVSNHGGRQLDGAPAPVDALPAIVCAVGGQASVLMDGGVRRGTDVVKALARGAPAGMTRPAPLFGVCAAG